MSAASGDAVRPARFAYASFAIMIAGWVAFAVTLAASRQTLDDVWTSVRELPLAVELVVWLVAFPFLVGLAIWQASWSEAARLAAIALVAAAYTVLFIPRDRQR
jgi:hypothetical protein